MPVTRISSDTLENLLEGKVKEAATCVLKFYSNTCPMCHNLSEYFVKLSDDQQYEGVHFFAVNIDENPGIEKRLNFRGVPTIFVIHTNIGNRQPTVRLLQDPEKPNDKTWYRVSDIRAFIQREAL